MVFQNIKTDPPTFFFMNYSCVMDQLVVMGYFKAKVGGNTHRAIGQFELSDMNNWGFGMDGRQQDDSF